ncbi:hypothetical protein EGW08_017176 [Elysia chlorotica]|uniref:SRCR domain-containing protein n=1 Tax=Elysia chlorotica TaxID=188477 RepID=A0A3S1B4X5_ELYCH|nr:hypothetical protein EGW08_017176 [Elysia chlorotica]
MIPRGVPSSPHIPSLTLLLVLLSLCACAASPASRSLRRSRRTSGDEAAGIAVPHDASPDVIHAARLQIWGARVTHVIEQEMSGVCRAIVTSVPPTREPKPACDKVRAHKNILGFACSDRDLDMFEDAVCNFDSVVVPTLPPPTVKPTPPETTTTTTTAGTTSTTTTTKKTTEAPTTEKKETTETKTEMKKEMTQTTTATLTAVSETTGEGKGAAGSDSLATDQDQTSPGVAGANSSSPQPDVLTFDSRLTETCNAHLRRLALALRGDGAQAEVTCHRLHVLAQGGEEAPHADGAPSLAQEEELLSACRPAERRLLHASLCPSRHGERPPTHALQGQQQERVNYVVETELSTSCRDAVSPLGKRAVQEDREDSCVTLRGAEGDRLVSNAVCTRGDLDNLLEAVCGSSPNVVSSLWPTCGVVALSLVVSWINGYL